MRAKLGEPHNSIHKLNRPLEEVTTPSLEALQNFTLGFSEVSQGHFRSAIPLLERAIAIDPNFAMAYYNLAVAFDVAGDDTRARGYLKQAFSMVDRVSEYERDEIVPTYYFGAGDLDKAIDAYKLSIRNYPRFWGFHNNFADAVIAAGQFEEGLKEGVGSGPLAGQRRAALPSSIGRLHLPGSPPGGQAIG